MRKHIEALEARRDWLVKRLSNDHPAFGAVALDDVLRAEKEALDWVLDKATVEPTQPVVETDPYTGEIISGTVEPVTPRTFAPIGNTGHYGPIRVGETVQALVPVKHADIMKGEVGKLTDFDRWVGEEYPYIATFDGGRKAAFAREDIRRID